MKGQPDVNQGALRPAGKIDTDARAVPDLDHPPKAGGDKPAFDLGTKAEENERENETLSPPNPAPTGTAGGERHGGSA